MVLKIHLVEGEQKVQTRVYYFDLEQKKLKNIKTKIVEFSNNNEKNGRESTYSRIESFAIRNHGE